MYLWGIIRSCARRSMRSCGASPTNCEQGRSPKTTTRNREMKRRTFISTAALSGAYSLLQNDRLLSSIKPITQSQEQSTMPFTLPNLPYPTDALEPSIDKMTMEIHHGKHHAAYVNNLNKALEDHPDLQALSLEALLASLDKVPENIRAAVRNNGGGHWNHSMFWKIMKKGAGGEPSGELANAIRSAFSSFAEFKIKFSQAGISRFGSGWAWLFNKDGKLVVDSTPNQDNPIMTGGKPVMGLDVWEHAYYLKYQNRRADYIEAWWNVVNWDAVAANYAGAKK